MSSGLTFAFVMDPISSIDIRCDTTFVLMLESQRCSMRPNRHTASAAAQVTTNRPTIQ